MQYCFFYVILFINIYKKKITKLLCGEKIKNKAIVMIEAVNTVEKIIYLLRYRLEDAFNSFCMKNRHFL